MRQSGTGDNRAVPPIYVTGHRNPDTDSIASAIGYAELKAPARPKNEYVAVRLGDCNAQTRWVLERSGAPSPSSSPTSMLRAGDVMQTNFPVAQPGRADPGSGHRYGARRDLELVPIVDEDGALTGVVTERALARRYIRESRRDLDPRGRRRRRCSAVVEVLEGELVVGEDEQLVGPRVGAVDGRRDPRAGSRTGDVVVVGNRGDAQRLAIELGAALLVVSNGARPADDVLALARERGTAVIVSPLDTYVSGRMITLAAPCMR